jgi:hypothetical protein
LKDSDGGLGKALRDNNYYVSDTNYGWGPNGIGDRTDIGNWWEWFRGPDSPTYLAALYAESGQHSSYSRLPTDPGGENTIIMFKSCFPNSNLKGNPSDPVPDIDHNPLKGQDCWSPHHTVANAKGIYLDLLEYFKTRQDKLFVVVTAPPVQDPTWAANARAFNNWLVNDWLDGYPYNNVFVFDFYNVLTSNGGDPYTSDAGWESGNHHRWWNNAVQHKTDGGSDTLAYPSGGDDHPNYAGNRKATAEFVDLLNVAYNRFLQGNPSAPHIDTVTPSSGAVGTEVTVEGTGFGAARGDSRVEFEGTAAVDYLEWSDTRIRCRVPAGALSGWLKVVTGRGSSNGFNFVVPLSRVETTFYFAEGYTGRGFDEWLCIMNREGTPAVAQVNYLFADGSPPFVKDYPVPGDARVTVNVNAEIGAGKEVSVKIESDGAVLAERPMYFDYQGVVSGGHDVLGVESPSTTWYFAEGYTGPGFDQYVCVLNPGDDAADLTFRFQTEEAGEVVRDGFRVPPPLKEDLQGQRPPRRRLPVLPRPAIHPAGDGRAARVLHLHGKVSRATPGRSLRDRFLLPAPGILLRGGHHQERLRILADPAKPQPHADDRAGLFPGGGGAGRPGGKVVRHRAEVEEDRLHRRRGRPGEGRLGEALRKCSLPGRATHVLQLLPRRPGGGGRALRRRDSLPGHGVALRRGLHRARLRPVAVPPEPRRVPEHGPRPLLHPGGGRPRRKDGGRAGTHPPHPDGQSTRRDLLPTLRPPPGDLGTRDRGGKAHVLRLRTGEEGRSRRGGGNDLIPRRPRTEADSPYRGRRARPAGSGRARALHEPPPNFSTRSAKGRR